MKASTLFGAAAFVSAANLIAIFASSGDDQNHLSVEEAVQPASEQEFTRLGDVWEYSPDSEDAEFFNGSDDPVASSNDAPAVNSDQYYQSGLVQAHHLNRKKIEQNLHNIKLDENGDVLLDNEALHALRKAFDHGDLELDNEAMNRLQNIIYDSLPSDVAQQTAKVVKDFHDYSVALKQRSHDWGRPQNIEERIALLDEQAELQKLFLGEETAGLLFSVENDSTRQMLEGMNIAVDDSLSRQEKNEKLDELFQRYANATPNIMNWDSRYDQFQAEKQAIMNAGLSAQEKESQIQALYQHSFSASERALLVNRDLNQI